MIKFYSLCIISLLLSSSTVFAQDNTSDFKNIRKNAISVSVLGISPLVGITYDRIVSENLSLEIGVGIPSFGAGVKFYPFGIKESKFMFHTGLSGTYLYTAAFGVWDKDEDSGIFVGYVPIGVSYFGKKGFNLGADIGPAMADQTLLYYNLKLGYRF